MIATVSQDGFVRLWDATTGVPVGEPFHQDKGVSGLDFSPDGSRLATACNDRIARVWPIPTPMPELREQRLHTLQERTQRVLTDGNMVKYRRSVQPRHNQQ